MVQILKDTMTKMRISVEALIVTFALFVVTSPFIDW